MADDHEIANYITCPNGHKVFVIWSDQRQCFAFTCDECRQHSKYAVSAQGTISVTLVKRPHR